MGTASPFEQLVDSRKGVRIHEALRLRKFVSTEWEEFKRIHRELF